jgi:hypothetical protein
MCQANKRVKIIGNRSPFAAATISPAGSPKCNQGFLEGWADFPVRAQEGGGEAGSRRRKGTARTTVRGLYNFDRIRGQVARISTSARFMFIAMAMNCR